MKAERPADERGFYPEFTESCRALRPRLQGWLRAEPSGAARRAQALAWSGCVVALAEHRPIPPGHTARLMAELAPWLRPGDPWEDLAHRRPRSRDVRPRGRRRRTLAPGLAALAR